METFKVHYMTQEAFRNRIPFETPDGVKRSDYTFVTEIQAETPDEVFELMNVVYGTELPIFLKCRSMSAGDLLERADGTLLYCSSCVWDTVSWV